MEIRKEMVMSSRRITVEELADEISISHGSCHAILCNHLKMKRVPAKVVSKLLTFERKRFARSGQFCGIATLGCYTMIMHHHTDHLLFLIS